MSVRKTSLEKCHPKTIPKKNNLTKISKKENSEKITLKKFIFKMLKKYYQKHYLLKKN